MLWVLYMSLRYQDGAKLLAAVDVGNTNWPFLLVGDVRNVRVAHAYPGNRHENQSRFSNQKHFPNAVLACVVLCLCHVDDTEDPSCTKDHCASPSACLNTMPWYVCRVTSDGQLSRAASALRAEPRAHPGEKWDVMRGVFYPRDLDGCVDLGPWDSFERYFARCLHIMRT